MDIHEAKKIVIEVITEIQAISGRPPLSIDDTCVPLCGLQDFDSFNALEATCELAVRLGKNIPFDENVCWDDVKGMARSVLEIAQALCDYPENKG